MKPARIFLILLLGSQFSGAVLAQIGRGGPNESPSATVTATPSSPITLGTQVTLTAAVRGLPKAERSPLGETTLIRYSFAARRTGEEVRVVRPFAAEPSAKWTPTRSDCEYSERRVPGSGPGRSRIGRYVT